MGRTGRKRTRKSGRNFQTCDNISELVVLNSWLADLGICCNKKLVLAIFDDTGRGVLTRKRIYPGEELLNLPLNLTINITTLLMDKEFTSIFTESTIDCFKKYKQKLTFQSLLAFFISFHKLQADKSKWYEYLKILPEEYTVPYFLPGFIRDSLDSRLLSVVVNQKDVIVSTYNVFVEILESNSSNNDVLKEFTQSFKMNLYEWAYFTVNTRCVYMDLTKVIDMQNKENNILNLVNDNTKIALCPYLDMINHSPKAKNETKLLLNKKSENINIENLKSDLFTNTRFSIYTNNNFDPYTQVFICYGDSYNLKLLTEYGFILPNNELDCVKFDFEDVELYLKSKELTLSRDQLAFISSHGLNKDLYIDLKGLSFNFYALLMVVKCYYKQNSDVSKIIYSSMDVFSKGSTFTDLIAPLVKDKIVDIRESISKLVDYRKDGDCETILNNCVELLCQYVKILEKFIKC